MRVLYLLLSLALLAPSPGGLRLEVAGDGATGVTVRALGADGAPVLTDVRLVLTATAESGGRTVGPVQLNPAGEGRGFYSSGPVLSPGRWRVVVTAPAPDSARAEAVVEARPAASPSPSARAAEPPTPSSHRWLWGLAALVAAAGFVGFVLLRRS